MIDAAYPLFPVFAFLGFIISLIPLPWHLQAWNSGTVYFMVWSALACLNLFVNSVVWAGNFLDPTPIWCEISIRIMLAASVGIPAASLCINRRLYNIATVQAVSSSRKERHTAILVDTAICVGFPLVYLVMVYVVQGHRYDILENFGCFPAIYNTIPTYFLSTMWPLVIAVISGAYCIATLISFNRRRLEFNSLLCTHSTLTFSRYFRLMALAMTDVMLSGPLAIFTIVVNATATPINPYISWADTHYGYERVDRYPAKFWSLNKTAAAGIEFSRWVAPVCAIIFFAFFGLADEAKTNYAKVFAFVSKPFRSASPPSFKGFDNKDKIASISKYLSPRPRSSTTESSTSTLPVYASPSKPTSDSLGGASVQGTDSLTTLQSPPSPIYPSKGYYSPESRTKPDSYYSCSEGPLSPTLTESSLPEYELKGGCERGEREV